MGDVWVLNASPLVLLGKIGRLDLLERLAAKTAGAILAQVKADRAAKLTEQLLVQTP